MTILVFRVPDETIDLCYTQLVEFFYRAQRQLQSESPRVNIPKATPQPSRPQIRPAAVLRPVIPKAAVAEPSGPRPPCAMLSKDMDQQQRRATRAQERATRDPVDVHRAMARSSQVASTTLY